MQPVRAALFDACETDFFMLFLFLFFPLPFSPPLMITCLRIGSAWFGMGLLDYMHALVFSGLKLKAGEPRNGIGSNLKARMIIFMNMDDLISMYSIWCPFFTPSAFGI